MKDESVMVSVVIPFWGSEADLGRALDALVAQSFRNFEVIIVMDSVTIGSGTMSRIRECGIETRKILNASRKGPFYSRIKGSLKAKGRFLWFMDHDDTVPHDFLESMVSQATGFGVDIVECPVHVVNPDGERPFYRFKSEALLKGSEILDGFMLGNSYNSMCTKLIARRLWLEVVDELDWERNQSIVYAEDMVCTVFLYRRARAYKSFLGTHYNYLQRSDSTFNTRDSDRVEASIHSFEWVLNEIDPILQTYAGRNELQKFIGREVEWCVGYLAEQSATGVSKSSREKLDRIRARYLEAVCESGSA